MESEGRRCAAELADVGSCEPPGGLRNAEGRRRTPGKYGSRIGKQEGSEGEGNARRTGKRRDPWPRQRAEDEQDQTLLEHHLPRWPDAHMMRMMCDACGTAEREKMGGALDKILRLTTQKRLEVDIEATDIRRLSESEAERREQVEGYSGRISQIHADGA